MASKLFLTLVALLAVPLAAGCAAGGVRAAGLAVTPTMRGEDHSPSGNPTDAVSSDGESVPIRSGSNQQAGDEPGQLGPDDVPMPPPTGPSSPAGGPPPAGPPAQPVSTDVGSWDLYSNTGVSLLVRYPRSYLVKEEETVEAQGKLRVGFYDRALAASPTADLQLPQFAIDVYDNPSRRPLDAWLRDRGEPSDPMPTRESVTVGGVPGVRITGSLLLAPNMFVWVARGPLVYRFTPIGEHAEQMLAALAFTP